MSEYSKGYADGYNRALDDITARMKKFYGHLNGNTVGGSVSYHIDQIAKEMREKYESKPAEGV